MGRMGAVGNHLQTNEMVLQFRILLVSVVLIGCFGAPQEEHQQDPLCPDEQPEFGASCSPEGLNCSYGAEECCGTTSPEIKIECGSEGLWKGYFVDTICHFGIPCPPPPEN